MVYIQSNTERTAPHHFDCACAMFGAIDSGLDYRLTSMEEVSSGKFDTLISKHLFVGSVEFMKEVFNRVKLTDVNVPVNSNRSCTIMTLADAHRAVADGGKLFIKPVDIKLFSGLILDGMEYSCLEALPDTTMVMAYDVFEHKILSEWRVYILENKVIDSRNYSGNFMVSPDYYYVMDEVVRNKGKFPVAYTIDVGILANKSNVIIEYQDMWAIGNYGIPNDIYLKALRQRYFEIMTNKGYSYGYLH